MSLSMNRIVAGFTLLLFSAGCSEKAEDSPDGGTGGSSGSAGSGATGGSAGSGGSAGGDGGSRADAGTGDASGGAAGSDGGVLPEGWTTLTLLNGDDGVEHESVDRVTAVWCDSLDACIVASAPPGENGQIYAASRSSVSAILFNGADALDTAGVIGTIGFTALQRTPAGLIALMSPGGSAFVSARSNFGDPGSFSVAAVGVDSTFSPISGLNSQLFLQGSETAGWLLMRDGTVYGADQAPGEATVWTGLWSPGRRPPFPADFDALKSSDPTLCDGDPHSSGTPDQTQHSYVSPDLSLVVFPTGSLNQGGSDPAGACVSTDRGRRFHHAPFPAADIGDALGPHAIHCTDSNHCWAINGLDFQDDSVYVFYTTNASQGAGMTWTKATLPPLAGSGSNRVNLRHVFFAPGNRRGWIVGNNAANPLLLRSDDGGATWQNLSLSVVQHVQGLGLSGTPRLHSGFALDANNIWIGGEAGLLLYSGNGGAG